MNGSYKLFNILTCIIYSVYCSQQEQCEKTELCQSPSLTSRYLFYDVNPPEGFNLRRDVYLRFAIFAHKLQRSTDGNLNNFKLVLPPWINLYHWRTKTRQHIPWSYFFDIASLQKFAPVIEMHEFFHDIGIKYTKININEVYVLQHFEDMFKTGNFEDKMAVESCNGKIQINFFHYNNMTSENVQCLSFHGHTAQLANILRQSQSKTIFFDHAEIPLHDGFGDKTYWQARRSMRFNSELIKIAADFRKNYLNSDDKLDAIQRPMDWQDEKEGRNARGGPYLSVHLRRRDFVWGRPNEVPTIEDASNQILKLLTKLNLKKVFISTDDTDNEYRELAELLKDFEVYRFLLKEDMKGHYNEGQVAIIDQIICSHARHFIGTHESTFSFRIQEEREIMGFPSETTYNRLCGKNSKCESPSVWKIVY